MSIVKALPSDCELVRMITHTTIVEVYPRYYPRGAVDFFTAHHSPERIESDIGKGLVYLCKDAQGNTVGTVTVKENEILRLFVLPPFRGKGFGRELLDFAERLVAKEHDEIAIDASFAAKAIYLKRGYRETEYHAIETPNGDFLCYDVMKKQTRR